MLKVIIADDEVKVCQLIYHLVDWKSMGLEIIAIVNDGLKAYETIIDQKPDIVITDIRMPNYDGIELIRRTKSVLPDTYFVIISGYSQFEYAQNAIKYGVEDYLLKPLKKKELLGTLTKILEKHNLLLSNNTEKIELKSLLHTSEEKVKKNLLAELLINPNSKLLAQDREALNQEFCCHFDAAYYTILIIRPFLVSEEDNNEMLSLLLTKIQFLVKEKLEPNCFELITMIWEDQILCIVNTDDSKLGIIKKQLNRMKIDILNLKDIFQNVNVIIGIGGVVNQINEIYASFLQAELSILNRFAETGQFMIEYNGATTSGKLVTSIVDNNMRNRILSNLELLDFDSILEEISSVENELEQYIYDGQLIYGCYNEIIHILLFGLKNYLIELELPGIEWFQKKFHTFLAMKDVFQWLKRKLRDEFDKYLKHKKLMDSKPIRQAKQYIHDNYSTAINLENVSNYIGFNPAYFSSLFKKETGENFMDYVIKVRIHNAKNFLLQTNKDVAEIAADVGYTDLKYFSKLFKKRTGLNPTEFRKIYG